MTAHHFLVPVMRLKRIAVLPNHVPLESTVFSTMMDPGEADHFIATPMVQMEMETALKTQILLMDMVVSRSCMGPIKMTDTIPAHWSLHCGKPCGRMFLT